MKKTKTITGWLLTVVLLMFAAACTATRKTEEISTQSVEENTAPAAATETPFVDPVLPEPTAAPEIPPTAVIPPEGTITTDSGLQYLELVSGDGAAPEPGAIVTMHMVGSLQDGTKFFDTNEQGQPMVAVVGQDQLLPGWEEGILLMKAGGSTRFTLPPELAFGPQPTGVIPANSTVILEVSLLAVEPAPEPTVVDPGDFTTTDSGLQYVDLEEGDGLAALTKTTATMHFIIWVKENETDNSLVVTSYIGDPISFVVGQQDIVFPGWDEGALDMKVGGKRQLVIPPELALGEAGGGSIPPNATLLMEIELVDVREPQVFIEVDPADYTTTDTGLKFYDLVAGTGVAPETGQFVSVHYTGWLEDGTVFDSSLDRGQPFTFQLGVGNVIPGWDEGVASMQVGGKRQLVIPADLGYGDSGAGSIPPGATLIFEVELLEIQP